MLELVSAQVIPKQVITSWILHRFKADAYRYLVKGEALHE
jgi:hypothetical protein